MPPPNEELYPNTNEDISPATLQVKDRVSVFTRVNNDVIIYDCTVTIVNHDYFSATNIHRTIYHADGTEEGPEFMGQDYEEVFNNFFGQTPFRWVKIEPDTPFKPPPEGKKFDNGDIGDTQTKLTFGGKRKSKRKPKKRKSRKYNSKRK